MLTNHMKSVSEPVHYLRRIREIFPDAIIAGGYYRDLYHKISFSDVDIFVNPKLHNFTPGGYILDWCKNESDIFSISFWENMFNITKTNELYNYVEDVSSEEEYEEDEITAVFEIFHNDIKYNIILIDNSNPITYIDQKFDFDLCKIYGDGTKISCSKEFLRDSKHNTLTFTEHNVSFEFFCHSMSEHLKKLKKKYPNFTVRVPDKHFMYLAKSKITI